MKKQMLISVIIGIIILIAGAFLYLALQPKPMADNQNNTNDSQNNSQNNTNTPPASDPGGQTTTPQAGKYVDFSDANFNEAVNERRILFFHAPWCPQCRALEKSIQAGQIPGDIVILKVDYDTSQSLRQKYGVTLQTTLVEIDKDGNLKKKFVAYDEPSLAALLREFGT